MTVQHIENDWKRPAKRTTLMWAGANGRNPFDGVQPGHVLRSAVVGPLVENTDGAPLFCMSLDDTKVDRIDASGAVWGRIFEPRDMRFRDAGDNVDAGRDAALDIALEHCASGGVQDDAAAFHEPLAMPAGRKARLNFGLVNQVVVLAFRMAKGSRGRIQIASVLATQANLADAMLRSDFGEGTQQIKFDLVEGAPPNSGNHFDEVRRLRSLIGERPVVAARAPRPRVDALDAVFKNAGVDGLDANPRLIVDPGASGYIDLASEAEAVLAAAGTRKRLDSGWLSSRRAAGPPLMATGAE